MNEKSARSLLWLAVVLILVGSMIGSPQGALLTQGVALLCALPSLFTGPRRRRIAGGIVVAIAALLAVAVLPEASREAQHYQARRY